MTRAPEHPTAVVVGGGFAGVGCAKELTRRGCSRSSRTPTATPG
jgi:cation diffusion facilitator CzcD-associated flavoprotein CzcO